jgi:uncharacterized heparinase superfamily protein
MTTKSEASANQSKAFPHGGLYILRSAEIYLMCVCHRIGVNGVGPHKHNDWLSFELCAGRDPVIIDPGTYCYTGNIEMRRLFRSTAYHNTAVVDGEEQIPIHNSMFALVNPSGDIQVTDWQSNESLDILTAQHTGYQRLADPVVHQRTFHLDKQKHQVTIEDRFPGKGSHHIEFFFHLDTEITCETGPDKAFFIKNNRPVMTMQTDQSDTEFTISNGWVSRAYHHKEPAQILSWSSIIDAAASRAIKHTFFLEQNLMAP